MSETGEAKSGELITLYLDCSDDDSGAAQPPRGPSGADGTYNCPDFDTQAQAQQQSDSNGDADGLDRDGDGVACETLP